MGEARPAAAGGRGGRQKRGASCHSYQWVESGVEPSTSFRFGSGSLGQEITERESGFIGVAASDDGGGGRGSGGVVRLWEVILRDESWGHSFIAVLIERGTPGRATL